MVWRTHVGPHRTTFERSCAELIKEAHLDYADWKLVRALGATSKSAGRRRWPIGPDDFDALVKTKTFTNGSDKDAVSKLYRKLATNLLGGAVALDYEGIAPPTVHDGGRLGRCLNLAEHVVSLDLQSVRMSNSAAVALFNALSEGALPALTSLYLQDNFIDDEGMHAIVAAFERGAMRALRAHEVRLSVSEPSDFVESGYNVLTCGLNLSANPGNAGILNSVFHTTQ
jgi:hypothetical protein